MTETLDNKKGLKKVVITSVKHVVQFTLFLPLKVWKNSYTWILENNESKFFDNIKEKNFYVLSSFESVQHNFIVLSWVVGAVVTALLTITAASGYGGAAAAFTTLLFGLIATYTAPLGIAITRELLSILIHLGKK